MINAILGTKLDQSQVFTEDGVLIPVTRLKVGPCFVVQIKTRENDGYNAVQIGLGEKRLKTITKPIRGHLKKSGLDKKPPRFLKEVRIENGDNEKLNKIKPGMAIEVDKVFNEGDVVSVSGVSKGKGFQGVVKRYGFAGGPRTHGQSDKERSPGSIGQTTTPGRVYKGKKMAGRMGNEKITIKNLKVVKIDSDKNVLTISGLVPGGRNTLLTIKKISSK